MNSFYQAAHRIHSFKEQVKFVLHCPSPPIWIYRIVFPLSYHEHCVVWCHGVYTMHVQCRRTHERGSQTHLSIILMGSVYFCYVMKGWDNHFPCITFFSFLQFIRVKGKGFAIVWRAKLSWYIVSHSVTGRLWLSPIMHENVCFGYLCWYSRKCWCDHFSSYWPRPL